ncbi:unnamed protein product [Mortierella alpina]
MPVPSYGVWVGIPTQCRAERDTDDHPTSHILLSFKEHPHGSRERQAAINVKSKGSESRLVFWLVKDFKHPLIHQLNNLSLGFHTLPMRGGLKGLDYLRGEHPILDFQTGALLPHEAPGLDNDILEKLEPILNEAITDAAKVFLFGASYGTGIHDIHMNQGSLPQFANGVGQDGAILLQHPDGHWEAVFLAFASQRIPTDDHTGLPLGWSRSLVDLLEPRHMP